MGGLGTRILPQHLPSSPEGLQLWVLLLSHYCPKARKVVISYLQYLRKNCQELFLFGKSPRTGAAREG